MNARKAMNIVAVLILGLQSLSPTFVMAETQSKNLKPNTDSQEETIHFMDENENEIKKWLPTMGETSLLQVKQDIEDEGEVSLDVPDGVSFDQKQTQEWNDEGEVTILYSKETRNIRIKFPQINNQLNQAKQTLSELQNRELGLPDEEKSEKEISEAQRVVEELQAMKDNLKKIAKLALRVDTKGEHTLQVTSVSATGQTTNPSLIIEGKAQETIGTEETKTSDTTEADDTESEQDIPNVKEPIKNSLEQQSDSGIEFRNTEISVKTGEAPFDVTNNPGYDNSPTNNIIRSFDKAIYKGAFSLNSKTYYKEVVMRFTGTLSNAFSTDGKRLNASFDAANNGELDKASNTASFDFLLGDSGQKYDSNSTFEPNIVLNIGGAKNGTSLPVKITAQVISAKNDANEVIDLTNQNIYKEFEIEPIKVSSKVNYQVDFKGGTDNKVFDFDDYSHTENNYSQLVNAGMGLYASPLTTDDGNDTMKSDTRGVTFPDGKITVVLKQSINRVDSGKTTIMDIGGTGENSIDPMLVYDYGYNGVPPYYNKSIMNVPNHENAYGRISIPGSTRRNSQQYVLNSGDITMKNNDDQTISVTFENYEVDDVFPNNTIGHNAGIVVYDTKKTKYFATNSFNLRQSYEPIKNVSENTSLHYKLIVENSSYMENGEEYSQNVKGEKTWIKTTDSKGSGLTGYVTYQSKDGRKIGSASNHWLSNGDSKLPKDSEFYGNMYSGGTNKKKWNLLEKWNPNESILNETKQMGTVRPTGFSDVFGNPLTMKIRYGVSKNNDYSLEAINSNKFDNYTWYSSNEEAIAAGGVVSAVWGEQVENVTAFSAPQLKVPRKHIGLLGNKAEDGTPYITTMYITAEDNGKQLEYPSVNDYQPSEYDAEGNVINYHSPNRKYGDSIYFTSFEARISKTIKDIKQNNANFTADKIVTWELQPWTLSGSTVGSDTPITDLKIIDTLPEGIEYEDGTSFFGNEPIEPSIVKKDNGETELTWILKDIPVGMPAMEKITFDTTFNQSKLDFGTSVTAKLTNKVVISADEDSSVESLRTSTQDLTVLQVPSIGISKTVNKPIIENEDGQPFTYTLTISNQRGSDAKDVRILDVLPDLTDGRGSNFSGTYRITNLSTDKGDTKYYYTKQDVFHGQEINKINPADVDLSKDGWTEYTDGAIDTEAKAILVVIDDLPNNQSANVSVELTPEGNKPGDLYINRVVGSSAGTSASFISNNARTSVANRIIQGKAWYDGNHDGSMDANEAVMVGVPVTLYKVDKDGNLEKVTKNLSGEELLDASGNSLVVTDKNGFYSFKALPGDLDYVVGFGIKDAVSKGSFYVTTPYASNVGDSKNSKVDATSTNENDVLTYVDKEKIIHLPALSEMTTPTYTKDYVNLGVTKPGTLEAIKTVKDINGKDINNGEVSVGDIIHYDIEVTNPTESSILKDVHVKDTLPTGLSYQSGTLTLTKGSETTSLADSAVSGQQLDALVGDLQGVGSLTIGFDVLVTKDATGSLRNVALATGNDPSGTSPKTPDTEGNTTVKPVPSLTKTASVESAKLGETFSYTLVVSNGDKAGKWLDAKITDTLDNHLQYVSDSTKVDGKAVSDEEAVWTDSNFARSLGDLEAGASHTITFDVRVIKLPANHVIPNTAKATGTDGDGKEVTPPDAQVDVPVGNDPNGFELKKLVKDTVGTDLNGETVKVEDTIHYDLVVTNKLAETTLTEAQVKDTLPAGLDYVADSLTVKEDTEDVSYTGDVTDNELNITIGEVKSSVTIGFDVTVTKAASGTLENIASIEVPGLPEETTPPVTNHIQPAPKVEKTASVESAKLGETFSYTLVVSNGDKAGKWLDAKITDTLDNHLQYVSDSTKVDGKAVSDEEAVWTDSNFARSLGDLEAGASHTITFDVRVIKLPANHVIPNIAKATGTDGDGKVVTPPDAQVDVSIVQMDKPTNESNKNKASIGGDKKSGKQYPQTGEQKNTLLLFVGLVLISLSVLVVFIRKHRTN